ncbi:MAG: hypothetical protein IT244_06880, partial [Bacteroidia bacterium]|nr:hypothetical protein [Bacteroidia bacterium]
MMIKLQNKKSILLMVSAIFLFFQQGFGQSPNCAVNAGLDISICSNQTMTLTATAGNPLFSPADHQWSLVSGASPVTITSPTSLTTTVTGFGPGTYIFQFRSRCSNGDYASDLVVARVRPTPASFAGSNISICTPAAVTLNANTVASPATGVWSAGAGTFSNINSPTSNYTPPAGAVTTLTWTATNGVGASACVASSTMTVSVVGGPAVDAGPNQTLTCAGSCATFAGSNPGLSPQVGFWSQVSGPAGAVITNPNVRNTQVCNLVAGTYVFRWTVSGPCTNGTDVVTITVLDNYTPPNAGSDQSYTSYCNVVPATTHVLNAQPLTAGETGAWTQLSGATTATYSPSSTNANVTVGNLTTFTAPYTFRFTKTTTASGCTDFSDHVVVHTSAFASVSTPTSPNTLLCDVTSANFNITYTDNGTMTYGLNRSIVEVARPAGATASSPALNTSNVAGSTRTDNWSISNMLYPGTYTYEVTYTNPCGVFTRTVSYQVSRNANLVNAGSDIFLPCGQTFVNPQGSFSMLSSPSTGATVQWSHVSGPNVPSPLTGTNTTSSFVANNLAVGIHTFRMTVVTGSTCSQKTDNMIVTVPPFPTTPSNAGANATICAGRTRLSGNNPRAGETGTWTVSPSAGITFSPNANTPNAYAQGLATSTVYTFTWRITSVCGFSTDDVVLTTTTTYAPPIATAGADQCVPNGTSTISLSGSSPAIPSPGTGNANITWTALTSGASVSPNNTRNTTATITGGAAGAYFFEYALSVPGCATFRDTVLVTVNMPSTAINAGADQSICGSSVPVTTTLTATPAIPSGAVGTWTQVGGPSATAPVFASPNAASTSVSNLFIGVYDFRFTLVVGSCPAIFDEVSVDVTRSPTVSVAGGNIAICGASGVSTYSTPLAANTPTVGTGLWSVVSSSAVLSFSSLTSPTATVSGLTQGTHVLRWTISTSNTCPPSTSDVTITVTAGAFAGPDDKRCDITDYDLFGNINTSGTWTNVSGSPTPTLTVQSSSYTRASGLVGTGTGNSYTFRYTIPALGLCPATSDDVTVIVVQKPSAANAGSDQEMCFNTNSATLNGNLGAPGRGRWFRVSGPNTPGAGAGNTDYRDTVLTSMNVGLHVWRYEINTDPVCTPSTDLVSIVRERTATLPADFRVCNVTNLNMAGNIPVINTGTWSQTSGPNIATFNNVNNPLANVSGLIPGTYVFRWTIAGPGVCGPNFDEIQIINDAPITGLSAGTDATIFINQSVGIGATPGTAGPSGVTFQWSPTFFLNSSTIENPTFSVGNARGVYPYVVRATSNSCTQTDEVIITVIGPDISGRVWDDGDGLYDGVIDGTGIGSPDGSQLYAYLSFNGVITEVATVAANGTYSFVTANTFTNYDVVISTTARNVGDFTPAVVLPTNWVHTNEQFGSPNNAGTGVESGTANGSIRVNAGNANVTNVDFGIDKRPESDPKTAASQVNPGGTVQVQVPALTGTDREDVSYSGSTQVRTFIVETLPGNANLYYNGVLVTLGQTIANYNPTLFTVDPTFNGVGTVSFFYAWKDSAQFKDLSPAEVRLPFTGITISGTVYNDGDGNYDLAVDGTAIGNPDGTQLYAYLVQGGIVQDKVTLPTTGVNTGKYTFNDVLTTTNYTVVISSDNVAISAASPATANLPTNWISTGEAYGVNNTGNTGLEAGAGNSAIAVVTATSNVTAVDFGIDKRPESDDKTATSQVNPGGTVQVQVPALTGNDSEDGAYSGSSAVKTIIVETLPANANLYYNGVLVTLGQTIANYNPALFTVDPTFNGGGTVVFTYAWKDSAQAKDLSPATVTIPFEGITLSGTVYNDGDGNYDLAVDGTGIGVPDATQLYAYLDSAGIVVQKVALPPAGTYTFTNVATTTTYNVVISSDNVAITAATPSAANLPTNWISTGEAYGVNNTGNTGLEAGAANSKIIVVTATSNVTAVDFGIDKRPESDDKTATSQVNPGAAVQVQVPALTGNDREDGAYSGSSTVKTIIIETLPTNANLYYNGVLVTLGQTI